MTSLQVSVGKNKIKDGIILPLNETIVKPKINFRHEREKYYTIIMVDPDAPAKYWLHWLIINNKEVVANYEAPNPPKDHGLHRYFFYLLEQPNILKKEDVQNYIGEKILAERGYFNFGDFSNYYQLKNIDVTYFRTENK